MFEELKARVCAANLLLPKYGLVMFTWGNASEIDRALGAVAIKPSGVAYEKLTPEDIVVLDLDGNRLDGGLNPSSDTPTHLEIYRAFPNAGGIVHTHSRWATVFAQQKRGIPPLGTTHADYFHGEIPCTRKMLPAEIAGDYERETGNVIIETFHQIDPAEMPAVLVHSHGPFVWGKDVNEAVHNAVTLEELAFMAWHNQALDPKIVPMQTELLDKHFLRKHGKNAYYGQRDKA